MVKTASFTLRHLHPTTQRTLHRARKLYNQSFAVKTYPTLQPLITQALEDVLQDNFPLTYRKIFRCLNDHYLDLAAGNMKADRLWRTTPLRKHRSHFLDTACHLADEETGLSPDPHTYFPIVADLATDALDLFHNPEYFTPTQENNPYGAQYLDDNGCRIGTNAYNTKAFAWTLEGALELAKLTVFRHHVHRLAPPPLGPLPRLRLGKSLPLGALQPWQTTGYPQSRPGLPHSQSHRGL